MAGEGAVVREMAVVVNKDGKPVSVSGNPLDAATFARCLGLEPPCDFIRMVPVIEFEKSGGAR